MHICVDFWRGFKDSLRGIRTLCEIAIHPPLYTMYLRIITLNVGIGLSIHGLFYLIRYILSTSPVSSIYSIFLSGFILVLWSTPFYLVSLLCNAIYTNDVVARYIQTYGSIPFRQTYSCYTRYSMYVVNKFYYQVVVILLTLETSLLSYIPYIGPILDCSLASLVYSYYSWEYSWSAGKIPHSSRYPLFESRWAYHLGFGSILGLIQCTCNFFVGYHIISALYPVYSMTGIALFTPPETIPTQQKGLWLFRIPVAYTNRIVKGVVSWIERHTSVTSHKRKRRR